MVGQGKMVGKGFGFLDRLIEQGRCFGGGGFEGEWRNQSALLLWHAQVKR